jgi:hypothetical protein
MKNASYQSYDNLKMSFKSSMKFDSRYTQDFHSLQNLDFFKLINKYSASFFSNKEFKHLHLPDTKNFKKLSRENSLSVEKGYVRISRLNNTSFDDDFNYTNLKNKYSKYIKKKLPLILCVLAFLIIIIILYNSD